MKLCPKEVIKQNNTQIFYIELKTLALDYDQNLTNYINTEEIKNFLVVHFQVPCTLYNNVKTVYIMQLYMYNIVSPQLQGFVLKRRKRIRQFM